MKGIVNLYKPKGWTSRDAVNKVRNILHVKEVGHMGTLDPQGEGVLPIGIGKGTRLFDALLKKDKVYEAEFAFGYETPTLDGDSEPSRFAKTIPSQSEIESKLDEFVGVIRQVPPLYSAKNVNGARAYDLARKGVDFTLEAAEVEVYSFELIKRTAENTYLMRIHCSAGTYIRSLCRDLAYSLDSLATMVSIKRVRAGGFRIEEAVTVEELQSKGATCVIPLEVALADFPRFDLPDTEYDRLMHGVKLPVGEVPETPFAVYCRGELFGLGEKDELGRLKIKTYLRD